MTNFFGLIITILCYKLGQISKKIPVVKKLPPIVVASFFLVAIIKIFNIDYQSYSENTHYITFFLIPATISLAYPIYKNIDLLKKNKRIIYPAFIISALTAIISTYYLSIFLNVELNIIESILPKSTTAPIAIEIAKQTGGIIQLTVCIVILTGIFGAMFGHRILKLIKVKNDVAIGLSMGASSHILGTARCVERGRKKQIVMSSIALVMVGIISAIIIPVFIFVVKFLNI